MLGAHQRWGSLFQCADVVLVRENIAPGAVERLLVVLRCAEAPKCALEQAPVKPQALGVAVRTLVRTGAKTVAKAVVGGPVEGPVVRLRAMPAARLTARLVVGAPLCALGKVDDRAGGRKAAHAREEPARQRVLQCYRYLGDNDRIAGSLNCASRQLLHGRHWPRPTS